MSVQCTASGDTLSRTETAIGGTTARTVACWVRKTTSSDNAFLEINYGGGVWGTAFSTFAGDMYIGDYSDVTSNQYIFTFTVNQWYHIAYTLDGSGNYATYVDGAVVASGTWSTSGAPSGTNWNFGQSNVELQDIVIYDAALSSDEVLALRAARRPKRSANLLAYYPFFAGANRTIDYSGNNKTLTSAGTPTDGADSAPAGWGGTSPRRIYIVSSTVAASGTGQTVLNGTATATVAAAEGGTGQTALNGSGTATVVIAASATGQTLFNGSGNASSSGGGSAAPRGRPTVGSRRFVAAIGGRRKIR